MAATLFGMTLSCCGCRGKFLQLIPYKSRKCTILTKIKFPEAKSVASFSSVPLQESENSDIKPEDEEFRVFEIKGLKKVERGKFKRRKMREPPPPRFHKMPIDQDWTKVWPAASSFKWSVVPFPVRQGYIKNMAENDGIIPGKYANAELMKIPNFLHLSPPHIEKHCNALKKFCTPWPEGLNTGEDCDKHFPITVIQSDYCQSGPSIRHPKSRIIKMTFKLSSLELDYHARDKFIRLLGDRYNAKEDLVTLEVDRCPLKQQNYDYCQYLITALYHESWKTEPWESEKLEADWEKYFWDLSSSRTSAVDLVKKMKELSQGEENVPTYLSDVRDSPETDEEIVDIDQMQTFKHFVTELHNSGENEVTLNAYKSGVLKLMGLKEL